jgi:hypothetical protein
MDRTLLELVILALLSAILCGASLILERWPRRESAII